ncbi:MAG: glutamine synthetase family protein [Lachnospiraceae bacterium]|nr:glutamine synthetase family protein [Lachnospiraceae bacterium]
MTKSEIIELIEEEDVQFIRLQFTDIFGKLKNIAVTPGQIDRVFSNRCSFEGSAIFGERYNYDERLYLYPNLDTFTILPWRPQTGKVAKITCDVCLEGGEAFEYSSRNILKKVLKDAKEKGYTFMVDPECEFFLFHTDENGLPTTLTHEMASYMDVGPVDFGENARRDIVLMLEEMGFEVESSHHEHASAQHEIDFKEAEALEMADSIQTFRFAVRSVAKRFGLYATFMPKPRKDMAGSGMHTNIVMFKDGKNVFRGEKGELTKECAYFMGGILKHAKALAAFANPTVNSYKRLISGFDAPQNICWSSKGENALVKFISDMEDTKVELRFPDGSSNPYLMLASCIAAGLDGVENKIEPGEDITKVKDANNEEVTCTSENKLPGNLKDAIMELMADDVIINAMGKDFTNIFAKIKNNEWNDYMETVSEWELDRYLTRI